MSRDNLINNQELGTTASYD